MKGLILFFLACGCSSVQIKSVNSASDECSLTPVIHVLQYPGCVPKPIPSFACIGRCGSYVQVFSIEFCFRWKVILKNWKQNVNQCENFALFERFRAVKSGKWKDHAIAVRNRENVKPPCRFFARRRSKASENSERSVSKVFLNLLGTHRLSRVLRLSWCLYIWSWISKDVEALIKKLG